jgi:uncharacterized protein (UPF0548 family)
VEADPGVDADGAEAGEWGLGPTPDGHHFLQRRILIASAFAPDSDDAAISRAFERARALLRVWGPQVGAGMRVEGSATSSLVGETAVLRTRIAGVLPMRAPVRVSWTVDDRDRAGFAYETLPGHPESGRESFVVTRSPSPEGFEEVWFTVTAYSRPAAWCSRLGGPVTRVIQKRYANKYLLAVAVRPK